MKLQICMATYCAAVDKGLESGMAERLTTGVINRCSIATNPRCLIGE
jgi:hypothetical protein